MSIITTLIGIVPNNTSAQVIMIKPAESKDIKLSVQIDPNEKPLRIIIPSVAIDLKVYDSEVVNGTWEVPEKAAGYGSGSSFLDENHGNSIVFAHARNGMFRNLNLLQTNDVINLVGDEGHVYTYRVIEIQKILPDEIDKVKLLGKHHLTLFTCDGFNDEYRLLVKSERIEVNNLTVNKGVI